MPLQIVPISCGYISGVERSAHQYLQGFGEKIRAQLFVWLITGGDFPIVVDVGPGDADLVRVRLHRELHQAPGEDARDGVAAAGVDPDAVRVVVQTHLHWDHSMGLELTPFPHAELYVQRRELAYAAAPYPVHAQFYDEQVVRQFLPTGRASDSRLRVVDGDWEVIENVRVILTPGHTPGTQAVLVNTGSGTYAIASDNVPFRSSWRGRAETDWVPSGIHVSLAECYASMARLADLADVVLPSHDPWLLDEGPFPATNRPTPQATG